MASFNPSIVGTPGQPPNYSPSVAETFSWVPIGNSSGRPLYAKAVYSVNRSSQHGQDGFDFLVPGVIYIQNYNAIQTITASTQINLLTADNSFLGNGTTITTHLTATPLPADFLLCGPIRGIKLSAGCAIGYK